MNSTEAETVSDDQGMVDLEMEVVTPPSRPKLAPGDAYDPMVSLAAYDPRYYPFDDDHDHMRLPGYD